ncbi:Fic family protein [Capnocytophaga canis]|uniref:Fic family protein n=1 Tax=Capnocytophaga canis TaxID=1848903 RepID=UPI0037D7E0F6
MKNIKQLVKEYKDLGIELEYDYDKFSSYALTHHSTAIEGSELSETDTQVLLDYGLTPKGLPITHSLMVLDHQKAVEYIRSLPQKTIFSNEIIQKIESIVVKSTGKVYHTPLGECDTTKGDYRLGGVRRGFSGESYMNYQKVVPEMNKLIQHINTELSKKNDVMKDLELSFYAHYKIAEIHPFFDGNGRTARLLMNAIQVQRNLPLSIVFKQDKADYINVLREIQVEETKNIQDFYDFMFASYERQLKQEINNFLDQEQKPKKGLKK